MPGLCSTVTAGSSPIKSTLAVPNGIELTAEALEGLRLLHDEGFDLMFVTSRSRIERGCFAGTTLGATHTHLTARLAANHAVQIRR